MKRFLHSLVFLTVISYATTAQTTVASGNWSNPATWGGAPPVGTGTVVINHTVTLDFDYNHSSGSITVGASGAVNGNSAMRGFALNFTGGTASLTINGTFNVARISLVSGTVINNLNLFADSLMNAANLTNNSGGTINADQFLNYTAGTLTNNGTTTSINFFNMETVINSGSMGANDFTNAKSFTNNTTGTLSLTHDFSNTDTLASPANFTNDGGVTVQNDWYNSNQINGSGKFCVANNSWNAGSMSGTFDFCDLSGSNVDLNTGTIAGTITYCTTTCSVGLSETTTKSFSSSVFPNPFNESAVIKTNFELNNSVVRIYNSQGQEVYRISNASGNQIIIPGNQFSHGLYFYSVFNMGERINGKFIVE